MFPATLSLVNTTFPEGRERNRAIAVWGAAGAAGLVIGVLLGGVLTEGLGWEAMFFVNVPLVATVIGLAFRLIRPTGSGTDSVTSTSRARSAPAATALVALDLRPTRAPPPTDRAPTPCPRQAAPTPL